MAKIDSGEDAEGPCRLERLAKSFRASYLAGTSHECILPLSSARRKRASTAINWVVARGVRLICFHDCPGLTNAFTFVGSQNRPRKEGDNGFTALSSHRSTARRAGLPVLKCVGLPAGEASPVCQAGSQFAEVASELPSSGHASGHRTPAYRDRRSASVQREL
jgi:hypothetical protein